MKTLLHLINLPKYYSERCLKLYSIRISGRIFVKVNICQISRIFDRIYFSSTSFCWISNFFFMSSISLLQYTLVSFPLLMYPQLLRKERPSIDLFLYICVGSEVTNESFMTSTLFYMKLVFFFCSAVTAIH